jgi:hypothetical protein
VTDPPLEAATQDVIARYKRGNDMLASAAVALRRLRERVEVGEAEGMDWYSYRHAHLEPHISRRWIEKQLQLAPPNATEVDVANNVEQHRSSNRNSVAEHRKRQRAEIGSELRNSPAEDGVRSGPIGEARDTIGNDGVPAHASVASGNKETEKDVLSDFGATDADAGELFLNSANPPGRGTVTIAKSGGQVASPAAHGETAEASRLPQAKEAYLALSRFEKYIFAGWVNEMHLRAEPAAATPVQTKTPADKTQKILAALAAAGAGLTMGELYNKAGAYLTDLDLAVKQGLIHEAGEKYFAAGAVGQ